MTSVNVASTGDVMLGSSSLTIVKRWWPPARASMLDGVARHRAADRAEPLGELVGVGESPVDQLPRSVEDPGDDQFWWLSRRHVCPLRCAVVLLSGGVVACATVLLDSPQVGVEPVEVDVPEPPVALHPRRGLPERLGLAGCSSATGPTGSGRSARPVSSTFRCREIAGRLMENGSASSVTVASPSASRARIARRVGSASAAKIMLSRSTAIAFNLAVN